MNNDGIFFFIVGVVLSYLLMKAAVYHGTQRLFRQAHCQVQLLAEIARKLGVSDDELAKIVLAATPPPTQSPTAPPASS